MSERDPVVRYVANRLRITYRHARSLLDEADHRTLIHWLRETGELPKPADLYELGGKSTAGYHKSLKVLLLALDEMTK